MRKEIKMDRKYRRRPYPGGSRRPEPGSPPEADNVHNRNVQPLRNSDIPLPNEKENSLESTNAPAVPGRHNNILDFIKTHIHFEEIVLIGLIFILLDEGIDDEFLLIILVYILLTW